MNSLLISLKEKKEQYQYVLEQVRSLQKQNFHERVRCETQKNHYRYYWFPENDDKHTRGIYLKKSQIDIAREIAQQEYYARLIPLLEERIELMNRLIGVQEPDQLELLFSDMSDARKAVVEPLFESVDCMVERWLKQPYEKLLFAEDDMTEIYSDNGERMRSKSEKIIADRYGYRGIPYKYEFPVELYDWDKKIIVHPDFAIFRKSTREILLHEHLGMMDNPDYAERALHKIRIYEKNGYLLGKRLFITFETLKEPLTTRIIDEYIDNFFL